MNNQKTDTIKIIIRNALSWNKQVAKATGMQSPLTDLELKEALKILED